LKYLLALILLIGCTDPVSIQKPTRAKLQSIKIFEYPDVNPDGAFWDRFSDYPDLTFSINKIGGDSDYMPAEAAHNFDPGNLYIKFEVHFVEYKIGDTLELHVLDYDTPAYYDKMGSFRFTVPDTAETLRIAREGWIIDVNFEFIE